MHPLVGDLYEIVEGHHRVEAARRAELAGLPCHVEAMDDLAALMRLRTGNIQTPLRKIDEGRHIAAYLDALEEEEGEAKGGRGKKGGLARYAETIGVPRVTLVDRLAVWRVIENLSDIRQVSADALEDAYSVIHELRDVVSWLKGPMVLKAIAEGWTVDMARAKVGKVASLSEVLPKWADPGKVATAILASELRVADVAAMAAVVDEAAVDDPDRRPALRLAPETSRPYLLSAVPGIVAPYEEEQADRGRAVRA